MTNQNFFSLIEARVPRNLDATFLETPEGLLYSWRDLLSASARLAHWLHHLPLSKEAPGQSVRVAVQVEKSPEALLLYLATLRAGFVYVPLNTAYQQAEVEYFLQDAQPAVFVCSPARLDALAPIAKAAGVQSIVTLGQERDGSLLEQAAAFPDQFATAKQLASDLAVLLYTSGTTGRSKGAMLTHRNLSSNAQVLDEFWGFKEERDAGGQDVVLHALPLFHIHGLLVAMHAALLSGSRMLFLPRFDAQQVLTHLPQCTVFMGVPTYYTRLLAQPGLDRHRCRNMRLFISGSAPLSSKTFDEFKTRTGHVIVERYGMSETMMLTSNPYFGVAAKERLGGTVGLPLPGVNVRVVNDHGQLCATSENGRVEVRGPNIFAGYWRKPEDTAKAFSADGWFRTGDLGHFGGAGCPDRYLTLVGRSNDLIISGGYNVYPKEVETCLDQMPTVAESAVIGVPHPDFGEAVVGVVVTRSESNVDPQTLIAQLKAQLANYKVPKQLWVIEQLPRNAMGKVQKNVLREQYRNTFTG